MKTATKTAARATTRTAKPATKTAKAPPAAAKAAPKVEKAAQASTRTSEAPAKATEKPKAPEKSTAEQFLVDDFVVYPTHGVGRVVGIERQDIAGLNLQLLVIDFEKEKMIVKVPVAKASTTGMRRLSSPEKMHNALATLKGRARVKRTMWSRRAQEYEAKINSGDPVSIAEVVRDLYRAAGQPEQSYSERQIYESALDRLVRELAAVEGLNEEQATERLEKLLRAA